MSYTPTEWQSGDIITAETLNKVEQGIADASQGGTRFDVNVTMEFQTDHYEVTDFDKTIEEINAAYNNGKVVVAHVSALGGQHILNLYGISEQFVSFTSCDVMGNQARILYLSIRANNSGSFYYKVIS